MIDKKNFFNQPVKNNLATYENILKIATGQGVTGCFLDYNYFEIMYKMNNKNLMLIQRQYNKSIILEIQNNKQQCFYPKAIQKVNFIGNLEQ